MSLRFLAALVCLLTLPAAAFAQQDAGKKPEGPAALKTAAQQASYGIGLNVGQNIKSQGISLELDQFAAGVRDAMSGATPRLTDEQLDAAFTAFREAMEARKLEKDRVAGEKNKTEGAAFLAANKKKEGVVALDSGLQYQVLKKGDGPTPKVTDTVRTHYHGTLINGTVFDSSVERGEPATFPVGGVIRGWTEALQLMKVGDKWRLFVPSELAYGERGAGGDIGPHAVLIFEVELLGIQ